MVKEDSDMDHNSSEEVCGFRPGLTIVPVVAATEKDHGRHHRRVRGFAYGDSFTTDATGQPKIEASEPFTPLKCCPNYVALVSEGLDEDWVRRVHTEGHFERHREVKVREMVWPIGFELDARAWKMNQLLKTSEYPHWAILVRNDMERRWNW